MKEPLAVVRETQVYVVAAGEQGPRGDSGVAGVFPFFKADGSPTTIGLISTDRLPFYKSSGSASHILLVPA